jgi:hypothetical protein
MRRVFWAHAARKLNKRSKRAILETKAHCFDSDRLGVAEGSALCGLSYKPLARVPIDEVLAARNGATKPDLCGLCRERDPGVYLNEERINMTKKKVTKKKPAKVTKKKPAKSDGGLSETPPVTPETIDWPDQALLFVSCAHCGSQFWAGEAVRVISAEAMIHDECFEGWTAATTPKLVSGERCNEPALPQIRKKGDPVTGPRCILAKGHAGAHKTADAVTFSIG